MAVAFGDRERASSVTEELERAATPNPAPTARGLALRCRGLLENDPEILLRAVTVHREGPRPHHVAAACEAAGLALGSTPTPNAAVPLLGEALATYERLAADWDAARVRTALATFGVTRTRRIRHRPTYGWDSLTPTERQVVRHAAEGLTNREIAERLFVSRRTVTTHMEHIFQKLGLANRVELAAETVRRGVTQGAASSS
jgi:DNA-binding CsgD family transcriptional regulator